jgi:hypothetical protein
VVDLKQQKFENANSLDKLKSMKEHAITSMCFVDKDETEVLTLQRNGQVNVYSALHQTYTELFNTSETESKMKAIQTSKR